MPAEAISSRGGLTGVFLSIGASIRVKRWPLERTSIFSVTWAWPRAATALSYWVLQVGELALELGERHLVLRGRLERGREVGEGLLDPRPLIGDVFELLVDRGELDLELGERLRRLTVGAGHRARRLLLGDEALEGGDACLEHADLRAALLVDRLLLEKLALQVLELLLLGGERDVGGAAGALEDPDHRGALVLQRRLLALEVEEALLLALLLGTAAVHAVGERRDVHGLEVGDLLRLLGEGGREPLDLALEEVEGVARPVGAHAHVLLEDQRHELVGALGGERGCRPVEGDADDDRARRPRPDRRVGLEADELDAVAHVADDIADREVGLVGVEADALREIVEVGAGHDPLLDDLDLLERIDLGGRLSEAPRDLLGLGEQARRGLVDRRQDRGDGDADRREQREDDEEVGQAPLEDGPVVLEVEVGHGSVFLSVAWAGAFSPPPS